MVCEVISLIRYMSHNLSSLLTPKLFKNRRVTYATSDVLMVEIETKQPFRRLIFRYCKGYIIYLGTVQCRCPNVDD